MQPLAYRLRPKTFDDIICQDHLVGKNGIIRKMIESDRLFSFILYGAPGCGKTTIANIIKDYYMSSYSFNASTDTKEVLKSVAEKTKYYDNTILIIDEIHRMKKDVQDYLLPFLESGKIIMIGLTTENPYRTINPAIRSRCHIYRLNEIDEKSLFYYLKNVTIKEDIKNIDDDVINYIVNTSSLEIRQALNMLEVCSLLDEDKRNVKNVSEVIGIKNIRVDQSGENYYDILSALIKSIRGSDVDASLHYLARFLKCEDLQMITRRLMISSYEDIGLANINASTLVFNACECALKVGLPEARIPLGFTVCLLATSPKSNSSYLAINKAIADLDNLKSMNIPPHILNKEIKGGASYLYPHDYPNDFVKQQYLPDELFDKVYYEPKDSNKYEKALKEYYTQIRTILKSK